MSAIRQGQKQPSVTVNSGKKTMNLAVGQTDDDLAAEMEGLEDLEDLDGLEDALENAEI